MYDNIYKAKNQQIFKNIMDRNFSDILLPLKNGKETDSFTTHLEQHFKSTKSRTYPLKCMTFKVVKQINLIGAKNIYKTKL